MNGHRGSAAATASSTYPVMDLATKKINKYDGNDCYKLPLCCAQEEDPQPQQEQPQEEEQQQTHGERIIELVQKLSIRAALGITSHVNPFR